MYYQIFFIYIIKNIQILSKEASNLLSRIATHQNVYEKMKYSVKEFVGFLFAQGLGEKKVIQELEIQFQKAQINQIYYRKYKTKSMLLLLDDKNINKLLRIFIKIEYLSLDLNSSRTKKSILSLNQGISFTKLPEMKSFRNFYLF